MEITFINHSSLLCNGGESFLITDPWIFSNAFQGWSQFPGPDIKLIKKILNNEINISMVLLSHAHDDHVDDIFLANLGENVKVLIPHTNNPGFKNRILNTGTSKERIIEVGERSIKIEDFSIASISNKVLTKEDFIFLIANNQTLFIHSNDNWHEFESETINFIQKFIANNQVNKIYLMSQIGIADSYPLFYKNISLKRKKEIIFKKIEIMCNSLIKNCNSLGLSQGYAYANQSRFSMLDLVFNKTFDPYLIKDQIIDNFNDQIKQLMPCDKFINGNFIKNNKKYTDLLTYRLSILNKKFNNYALSKSKKILPINFKSLKDYKKSVKDEINLYGSDTLWNDILNGNLNLESIITGGMGFIEKPESYNMKEEYLLLSSWAYINQNKAIRNLNLF